MITERAARKRGGSPEGLPHNATKHGFHILYSQFCILSSSK
jgi:hypothetical protein